MHATRSGACAALLAALLLAGCTATQPTLPFTSGAPGFMMGLWHGFIAPLGFILGLFTDARIYAFPNSGLWYDLGFMLGIGGFSSGIFAGSRKK